MNQENKQSNEKKAAAVLKDIYKSTEDSTTETKATDNQTSPEENAEQLKGSDADVDQNVGHDDKYNSTELAEQQRGSDADVDKSV